MLGPLGYVTYAHFQNLWTIRKICEAVVKKALSLKEILLLEEALLFSRKTSFILHISGLIEQYSITF